MFFRQLAIAAAATGFSATQLFFTPPPPPPSPPSYPPSKTTTRIDDEELDSAMLGPLPPLGPTLPPDLQAVCYGRTLCDHVGGLRAPLSMMTSSLVGSDTTDNAVIGVMQLLSSTSEGDGCCLPCPSNETGAAEVDPSLASSGIANPPTSYMSEDCVDTTSAISSSANALLGRLNVGVKSCDKTPDRKAVPGLEATFGETRPVVDEGTLFAGSQPGPASGPTILCSNSSVEMAEWVAENAGPTAEPPIEVAYAPTKVGLIDHSDKLGTVAAICHVESLAGDYYCHLPDAAPLFDAVNEYGEKMLVLCHRGRADAPLGMAGKDPTDAPLAQLSTTDELAFMLGGALAAGPAPSAAEVLTCHALRVGSRVWLDK